MTLLVPVEDLAREASRRSLIAQAALLCATSRRLAADADAWSARARERRCGGLGDVESHLAQARRCCAAARQISEDQHNRLLDHDIRQPVLEDIEEQLHSARGELVLAASALDRATASACACVADAG